MEQKRIKIFKTFEEQELHKQQREKDTTPLQRFKNLFLMQQLSLKFRPVKDNKRAIVLPHGCTFGSKKLIPSKV